MGSTRVNRAGSDVPIDSEIKKLKVGWAAIYYIRIDIQNLEAKVWKPVPRVKVQGAWPANTPKTMLQTWELLGKVYLAPELLTIDLNIPVLR